jgi:hypothetical protein
MTRPEIMDLGHGVTVQFVDCECGDPSGHEHRPCGIQWHHLRPDGTPCVGLDYIPFGAPHGWVVESREPLTLSPSLLCRACNTHGFIRGGKWVPA